jgi:hypothetical protein
VKTPPEPLPEPIGCVFAKSCNLPNSVIDYRDFILFFPADSGKKPLYIVMNVRLDPGVVTGRSKT